MVIDCYIESCLIISIRDLQKKKAVFKTVQQLFTYKNPKYIENEKWGYSNHDTPSKLYSYQIQDDKIIISRGGLKKLQDHLSKFRIKLNLIDRTSVTETIDFNQSNIILRPEQETFRDTLLIYNDGCAKAYTSFGKTVVSAEIIAAIKQRTLILVHTTFLQKQWIQELTNPKLFNLDPNRIGGVGGIFSTKKDFHETLPMVHYESKRRKLGDINVCLYHSIAKENHLKFFEPKTGLVIFDEGQKSPIEGIQLSVSNFRCRYRYAVSADFKRKDGKEFLTFDTFGPIRVEAKEKASASKILANIKFVKSTYEDTDYNGDNYQFMITKMGLDKARNILICKRLIHHVRQGKLCMVFVERKSQAAVLFRMLSKFKVDMLLGATNWKDYSVPHLQQKWAKKGKQPPESAMYAAMNMSSKALDVLKNYDSVTAYDRIKRLADKKKLQIIIGTQKAEVGLSIRPLDYGLVTTHMGNNLERFNQTKGRFERTYSEEQKLFFGKDKDTPLIEVINDYKMGSSTRSREAIKDKYGDQVSSLKKTIKKKVIKRRRKK